MEMFTECGHSAYMEENEHGEREVSWYTLPVRVRSRKYRLTIPQLYSLVRVLRSFVGGEWRM